ncbi:hypothetical protein NESM_000296600 [Novymonas esmeraldas]|uniref:Uncharacterized protein n=1 Tax=Novymonas esmeraldas TaxID=1808958 RepID=A0AAW0FCA9_9TRYP
MVCVRVITDALVALLDGACESAEAQQLRRGVVEERLHALVHTQSPSALESALWIYLVAQQQLLLPPPPPASPRSLSPEDGASEASPLSSSAACPLPPPLQLPRHITRIGDAVRWYGGELAAPADDDPPPTPPVPPARPTAHKTFRMQQPEPRTAAAAAAATAQWGERIDALLRLRRQTQSLAAPSTRSETGPLATVQLALDALAQPRRASALRQPRTLSLLVRDLQSLWGLVYLCRLLKRHQLRKERLLTGAATAAMGSAADATESAPLSVCFHDFELLLEWDVVQRLLSPNTATSMAAVAGQCSSGVHNSSATDARRARTSSSAAAAAPGTAATPAFALVINPAVTEMDNNPDRLRKNARVDAIEDAASKYYYTLLSTCGPGHGASAAAHQDALRSSLSTAEVSEYGVLDPSRMRAPLALGGAAAATAGAAGTAAGTAATSYSLFLRDASIGVDMQVMAVTGAGVGYYLGYLRGLPAEWCALYAVVGLVSMMLVDAALLMIRVGRQDEAVLKARRRIQRQREKLEREGERLVHSMQATAGLTATADAPVTHAETAPLVKKHQ